MGHRLRVIAGWIGFAAIAILVPRAVWLWVVHCWQGDPEFTGGVQFQIAAMLSVIGVAGFFLMCELWGGEWD